MKAQVSGLPTGMDNGFEMIKGRTADVQVLVDDNASDDLPGTVGHDPGFLRIEPKPLVADNLRYYV